MSHISKQTIVAVAKKLEASEKAQADEAKAQEEAARAAFSRMMQESFNEAQAVTETRRRFAEIILKELVPNWNHDDRVEFTQTVFHLADVMAQEHHRRATLDQLAWFASKGITPSMPVADAAKRLGLAVPEVKPEAPPSLVSVP